MGAVEKVERERQYAARPLEPEVEWRCLSVGCEQGEGRIGTGRQIDLAISMAYWFSRDFEASIAAAKRGLALDPHNTDLLAELGFRYSFMENGT